MRRLRGDEPSKAITSGARSEFLHPTEDRYLTPRECARIQTFPDDFIFFGSLAEQDILIGNAVPPRLGEVLGQSLFADVQRDVAPRQAGALLSFVPTAAEGMSPALAKTTADVRARFPESSPNEELTLWG
jgi:DNA (cytosine-5)-methyltransferase 1